MIVDIYLWVSNKGARITFFFLVTATKEYILIPNILFIRYSKNFIQTISLVKNVKNKSFTHSFLFQPPCLFETQV